jgi:hypothetical protein
MPWSTESVLCAEIGSEDNNKKGARTVERAAVANFMGVEDRQFKKDYKQKSPLTSQSSPISCRNRKR